MARLFERTEEALLVLEVRSAEVPKLYLDVIARHAVGGDRARLNRAARQDGTTNADVEADNQDRYPLDRRFYKAFLSALGDLRAPR